MPFDEALAIADSAVRAGDVTQADLLRLAEQVPSTGRAEALRVARCVDGRAANPFESVLRAIGLEVRGLDLEPQVDIVEGRFLGRPDLVDQARRLVLEAESFEFHGRRWMLDRDCVCGHIDVQPSRIRGVRLPERGRVHVVPAAAWAGSR